MKAMMCRAFGAPDRLRLETVAAPEPGGGEVLVRVLAAGVNFPDLLSVAGTYPIRSEPPFIPGIEGAGVVAATGGGVTGLAAGDLVCWQDNVRKSAFAEYVALPYGVLSRVPEGLDPVVAAAVPTAYGTAWFALSHRAALRAGETLLVHGASGGTGLAAVQLGRHMGATVIATGGSARKLDIVRSLGADHVIDLSAGDFRKQVDAMTGGRGVDVVFDPVGGDLFEPSVRALRPYGRMLVIGFTSGDFPVARANILLVKAASVIGVNYGHYLAEEPDVARDALERILGWVAAGRFAPRINATYALDEAAEALRDLARRQVVGKNVIEIVRR